MILILPHQLTPEALIGVVDEYINREGTDYGHHDYTLSEKRRTVLTELERGTAVICFDPETESTSIILSDQL